MTNLICLGDSLTFGSGMPKNQKWTTLAASQTLHIRNLGVPGDTTSGMLARLQTVLQSPLPENPIFLIMGGSNDIFFSGSDLAARNNLAAMVHQLSATGYKVMVGIPLPISPQDAPKKWADLADFDKSTQMLTDYCRWITIFCRTFHIPTVDFRKDYVNQDGSVRRELYLDGLHPNAEGHSLMANTLLEVLP